MPGKYPNENVLVVPRPLLDGLGSFQGLQLEPERYLPTLLHPANNFFLARNEAEEDPGHKQLIPYAIFHHEGRFLHYVRGGGGGEKRLASKGSIGIGGHVNDTDAHAAKAHVDKDTYAMGVEREIAEELHLGGGYSQRIVALLNDDANPVGQVHLGVVHWFDLESPDARAGETNLTNLEWLSLEELQSRRDQLETWSQICVDGLPALLAKAGG